ncbi:hypothetical protein T4E_8656 [Trichinella pseudospiralis]|uniref:Serum response factor-binding protein 1 n=1 Tax=Trichinella pseudospiralis TaxID=6337 RepID=A0A0V0XJJ8_TRIPS|nr:hypothetical protein T4E_8656 [Trichinella pseudospiralis]
MQIKQPYVTIPSGPEGKPLLRAHLHKQAELALLNLIASKQTEHIDEVEKVRFSDCTFNANTAEEYAECMLPYLQHIPQSKTRIKSSDKSQNVSAIASINETWIGSFKLKRRFPRQVTLESKQLQQMEAMNRFAVKKFTEEAVNHRLLKVLTSITQKLSLHSPASEVIRSVKEKMNISDTKIISESERRQKLIRLTKRLLSGNINDDSESEIFGWNYLRKAITDTEKMITNAVTNGNPLTLPKWQYDMMQLVKGMITSTLKDNSTKSPPTRLLSPRILSITPHQRDMINLLSPDLFSLFENDDPNNLLPLPQLFQSMHKADQEVLIEMIMDVTGAGDILSLQDEIMPNQPRTLLETLELFSKPVGEYLLEDTPEANLIPETQKVFKQLEKSLTQDQHNDMTNDGFAFLEEQQLDLLYGSKNPFNITSLEFDRKLYAKLNNTERRIALMNHIRKMGEKSRTKRSFILEPIFLKKVHLAPSVRAPIILSPILLSTAALSPAVLGPIILSPFALGTLTLSPKVISSAILSPVVMFPLIISPLVLCPIILNPFILNPIVLSPNVLNPIILSPSALTPLILSPFVLSPFILSGATTSAVVLTPRVLSPLIKTPLTNFALICSPAVLSRKKRALQDKKQRRMKKFPTPRRQISFLRRYDTSKTRKVTNSPIEHY